MEDRVKNQEEIYAGRRVVCLEWILRHPRLCLNANAVIWFGIGLGIGNLTIASIAALVIGYLCGYLILLKLLDRKEKGLL